MSLCVNVKVKYIRPKYRNLKEWCEDPQNVYIGRKGVVFIDGERYPKKDSVWANPYKVSDTTSRDEAIEMYRLYIMTRLTLEPLLKEELALLKGKTLGCWCSKEPCHGDVLVELATIMTFK